MTREEIIRMAWEAGGHASGFGFGDRWAMYTQDLERFAALVAAAEREACAKVCEEDDLLWGKRYAAAIRARGQK